MGVANDDGLVGGNRLLRKAQIGQWNHRPQHLFLAEIAPCRDHVGVLLVVYQHKMGAVVGNNPLNLVEHDLQHIV